MSELLLEIGCENLPPLAIAPAVAQLKEKAAARLDELRLDFDRDALYATGTPRRLTLIVSGLASRQRADQETVTGPPASRAFDEDGQPSKAAAGFARAQGIDVKDLKTIVTERGEFVGLTRKLPMRAAAPLLREMLPDLIGDIRFPKTMHWESSGFRFGRPIRWIVCLLDGKVVRFELAGVKSGDVTYSVPWIQRRAIRVRSAKTYKSALKKAGVILDQNERADKIEEIAQQAAKRLGLKLVKDPELIHELTFMLENPRPLVGDFDKAYLKLPEAVVVTAMRSHQRYMAFRRGKKLVPKFLTLTEGSVGAPSVVRRGNEKVLKARLEDALFYWNEDLKTGVDGLADKLASIVFIEGLGTLSEKSTRVAALASVLQGMNAAEGVTDDDIARAARIAKADLASEMIKDGKEFTLLQGLIGSFYADASGEARTVAEAIREQYLPRNPGDPMPASELGTLLSIADRVDTIAGCFLAGLTPSGSQDPYALRRQANGLLRMLESRPGARLEALIEAAVDGFVDSGYGAEANRDEVVAELVRFFQQRTGAFLKERGIAYDVVAAVSAVTWGNPAVALQRARAIQDARGDEAFELLITGAKRVGNILAADRKRYGADWSDIDGGAASGFKADLFEDEAERGLAQAVTEAVPHLKSADQRGDMVAVIAGLAALGSSIDHYFDRVLVNSPDAQLKDNRHAFLSTVFALFSKYADFSHIVEDGAPSIGTSAA